VELPDRKDKTGSRTFPGTPSLLRKRTSFELKTYMTGWTQQGREPAYGPLFRASLGGTPLFFPGGMAASYNGRNLTFSSPHGLSVGQALTLGGELRFVTAVADPVTVELCAPFTSVAAGLPFGPAVTYCPTTNLPSVSIFDYWSPGSAVQRIVCGAAVDQLRIDINADYHEFDFSGPAQELIDSESFTAGQGGLQAFPVEPPADAFDYSIIPGHLGQVWLGSSPNQFLTLTAAALLVDNDLDTRIREFGCQAQVPQSVCPGQRTISLDFDLFEQDDTATKALYQAARQRSPITAMFQLGQQPGQMFGIYLKSVMPEVPEFDDSDRRLEWRFAKCRAQGTLNDEIYLAFG
jgi:hypothetical protein